MQAFFPVLSTMVKNTWKLSQLGLKPHAFPTLFSPYCPDPSLVFPDEGKTPLCDYSPLWLTIRLDFQANTVSSVLRTSSMRSILLERTSSLPTTSCGPSSCLHPVVAWTRRPHTLWKVAMLATGRTRSTDWSGGWTDVLVSFGSFSQRWSGVVNDAYSFPVLSTMVKIKVYIKPNMSETTSYIKLNNLVIVDIIFYF